MLLQSQDLRPLTTAHLAQTMTLLTMTVGDLHQKIESELSTNPALELVEEQRCNICGRVLVNKGHCPVCTLPYGQDPDLPIVFVSPRDDFYPHKAGTSSYGGEVSRFENFTPMEEDLPSYVFHQIAPDLNPDDRPIAANILSSLDEDGFLTITPQDLCRFHHATLDHVKSVLQLIQRADPIGVGCQCPEEALLIQLDVLSENDHIPPLAKRAIQEGMDLLYHRQFKQLAHLLDTKPETVEEIARFISENLNPFPTHAHWGNVRQRGNDHPKVYTNPDVIIKCLNDQPNSPLVVEIVIPIRGYLTVSKLFKKSIQKAPEEKIEQWKKDLERASLLVKCLQQRNNTMQRLMYQLTVQQRDFILRGDEYLKPKTRASMAKELEVHESTVSRAVSGKTIQLPNGRIIPLERFFDRSLPIRTILCNIIEDESEALTDSQLAGMLAERGHEVARRTVAKYRSIEGILPSHLRKHKHENNKV